VTRTLFDLDDPAPDAPPPPEPRPPPRRHPCAGLVLGTLRRLGPADAETLWRDGCSEHMRHMLLERGELTLRLKELEAAGRIAWDGDVWRERRSDERCYVKSY
jgi:hypothetical protein